jgi:hypothetical protein
MRVRIYKLKAFARFQRRERIASEALEKAVRDAKAGSWMQISAAA